MKFGKAALLCILFSLSCGFLTAIPGQELVQIPSMDDYLEENRDCHKKCAAYTAYLSTPLFLTKMLLWDSTAYPFYFAATTALTGLLLSSGSEPEHEE